MRAYVASILAIVMVILPLSSPAWAEADAIQPGVSTPGFLPLGAALVGAVAGGAIGSGGASASCTPLLASASASGTHSGGGTVETSASAAWAGIIFGQTDTDSDSNSGAGESASAAAASGLDVGFSQADATVIIPDEDAETAECAFPPPTPDAVSALQRLSAAQMATLSLVACTSQAGVQPYEYQGELTWNASRDRLVLASADGSTFDLTGTPNFSFGLDAWKGGAAEPLGIAIHASYDADARSCVVDLS